MSKLLEVAVVIRFAEWISDNRWIRDPLPRKEFDDGRLRYSNIAAIDIESIDNLEVCTIEDLYNRFVTDELTHSKP